MMNRHCMSRHPITLCTCGPPSHLPTFVASSNRKQFTIKRVKLLIILHGKLHIIAIAVLSHGSQ